MYKTCIGTTFFLSVASMTMASTTLFEQGPNGLGSNTVASDSIDPAMFTQGDNFSILETSSIESVTFTGSYQSTAALRPDSFTISIHEDAAGLPAAVPVYSTSSATITRTATGVGTLADYEATLPSAVVLDPGNYWIAIQNATADAGSTVGRWGWARVNGDGARARIFGSMSPDWEAISNGDLVFALCGEPVTDSLVHFWDFEGDGGVDHAGTGNGAVGTSATFAGPDSSEPHLFALGNSLAGGTAASPQSGLIVPHGDFFQIDQSDFTISFAYKRGVADTGTNDEEVLFNAWLTDGWQIFTFGDAMYFRGDPTDGGTWFAISDPVDFDPAGNEWNHFTIRCDRSGVVGWYVDGVAASSQQSASIVNTLNVPVDLWIGGYFNSSNQGLDGCLDRVRIYNYALSDSEIAALAREVVLPDPGCQTDFDSNGATDSGDLATLLAAWGVCP